MHGPLHPRHPTADHRQRAAHATPAASPPATPPATGGVAPLQPLVARPWGVYIAGGCLGVVALAVLGVIAFFLLIGMAVVAAVLALVAVVLTICVLVLRDMWRETKKGT